MILWCVVVGALFGWTVGDFEPFGLMIGGAIGAGLGVWLQSVVRQEISASVAQALARQSGGMTRYSL